MIPALSAIMVVNVFGMVALAGIGTSMTGISRVAISYPIGALTDRFGRRVGLMAGISIGLIGAIGTGLASVWVSFPLFLLSMFVFGLGVSSTMQIRLAAADMYPPSRRAEGLGWVLSGSLVGAFGAPLMVSAAESLSVPLAIDAMSISWLLIPLTIVPAIVAIGLVRPDPKEIAANLDRYYPGQEPAPLVSTPQSDTFDLRAFLASPPNRVAVAATLATQGTMSMMMAMTGLVLAHQGHALHAISFSVAIHVVGMFGLSLPLGRLTDVVGRRAVMLVGLALGVGGSVLIPSSNEYWSVTAGIFLVGVGWSCVNVAATALLVDTTLPTERGRAIGTNDTIASASAIALPLMAGPMVDLFGLQVLGLMVFVISAVPIVLLIRLREPRPGHYPQAVAA